MTRADFHSEALRHSRRDAEIDELAQYVPLLQLGIALVDLV
jgi:hypothetical protein